MCVYISMNIIEKVFKYGETELSLLSVKMTYGLEARH